jgi:hypothetical protein
MKPDAKRPTSSIIKDAGECEDPFDRRARTSWRSSLLVLLVLIPPSILIQQLQAEQTNRGGMAEKAFNMYLDGTIGTLFSARLLPAETVGLVQKVSGGRVSSHGANAFVQIVALCAGLFATHRFALLFLANAWALSATLLTACLLPWGFLDLGYASSWPYDFPALFFSAAGMILVLRQRAFLFGAVLILGTLNKETMVWLIPAWFFHAQRGWRPDARAVAQTLLFAVLFYATYQTVRFAHADLYTPLSVTVSAYEVPADGSHPRTPRAAQNLKELVFEGRGRALQNVYLGLAVHLVAIVFLFKLPRSIRRLYWATPFFFLPLFFFGNICELRLYNELLPLGTVSVAFLLQQEWASSTISAAGARAAKTQIANSRTDSGSTR